MKKSFLVWIANFFGFYAMAIGNDTTGIKIGSRLTLIGFVDSYYAYDFNQTTHSERGILANGGSPFYSHTNHNQISINNILLGARYNSDWLRANVILHAGTYVQKNYAAEPDYAKYIYEANAGIRLVKNLWIDAGVFTSHIGLESALSLDNIVLTRSLSAENTPYYLSGAKITYETENKKWLFCGLVLNGWQTIQSFQRPQKAFGTQIQFRPSDKLLINSSTFIGPAPIAFVDANGNSTNLKGGDYLQRFLHNLYATWQVSDQWMLAAAFDLGLQQKTTADPSMNVWYNPTFWAKVKLNSHWSINGRLEHYNDKYGIIIPTGTPNHFQATGYSLGLDYSPIEMVALRIEGRSIYTTDLVFVNQVNGGLSNNCTWFTTSIAAYLR